MERADKKAPKKVSKTLHDIIKASVDPPPKAVTPPEKKQNTKKKK